MANDLPPAEDVALEAFQADECVVEAPYDEATLKDVRTHPEFAEYDEEIQAYILDVAKYTNENPLDMCLSVGEAWDTAYARNDNPYIDEELGYTQAQMTHVDLVSTMSWTPEGEVLLQSASDNGVMLCVDNNVLHAGEYVSDLNIATYELANEEWGFDYSELVMERGAEYSYTLRVAYEELAHAAQFNSWDMGYPDIAVDYNIVDEKIWDDAIESHARLITFGALVNHAQQGDMQYMTDVINTGASDTDMARQMMSTYLEHGADDVANDPTLLAPVFEQFFENTETVDAYFDGANPEYYNSLNSEVKVPMKHFTSKFGKIPGIEGNILEGRYDELTDVTNLVPVDSNLGEWLKAHHDAAVKGEVGPDMPVYEADCVAPEATPTTAELSPFNQFDGIGGITPLGR